MSTNILANLKGAVEVQVATDKKQLNNLLKDSKINIAIIKGPQVLARIVKITPPRKRTDTTTVSSITLERIRVQKQLLTNNVDALYVFTLIEQTKENLKKLNLKDMKPEAVAVFNQEIQDLITKLAATQKLLTHKPRGKEK